MKLKVTIPVTFEVDAEEISYRGVKKTMSRSDITRLVKNEMRVFIEGCPIGTTDCGGLCDIKILKIKAKKKP